MKRWSLPASAFVLVLIACGAGATSAPRVAKAGRAPSVRVIAERREQSARRAANRLLRDFRVPPGARSIPEPRGYGVLRRSGPSPVGEVVDVHRFWSVRKSLKTVAAFLGTHRLHGFEHSSASWGGNKPHYLLMSSKGPSGGYLNVTSVGLARRTVIRVDVQVSWIYPRSPNERVPADTRAIVVRSPKVSTTVRDPAKVARIIRWFDALPISPPGIAVSCPAVGSVDISLSFRGAGGARLAHAFVPPTFAWICDTIAFSIGGKQQKPLIDRADRPSFVRRLQQLLGVHLLSTHR